MIMPEHLDFNQEAMLYIMWIDGEAALHIVETGTTFSAARVLAVCVVTV
jgi:hypothetical protein